MQATPVQEDFDFGCRFSAVLRQPHTGVALFLVIDYREEVPEYVEELARLYYH